MHEATAEAIFEQKHLAVHSMQNQVVIITGASSGIGQACALEYAKQGDSIVIAARNYDKLKKLETALVALGAKVLSVAFDITLDEDRKRLIDQTVTKFGRIDVLINNAGISQRSLAKNTLLDVDRQLMEVNYFGTIALTKYALQPMIKAQSGHIAVISSIVGKFGFPLRTGYSATKHALHGYFESLRAELHEDNIKVSIICPGRIKTNISINALTEDGSTHSKMDEGTEAGLSAESCARQIVRAISSGKKETYIGGKEILMIYIRRFLPGLFYKMILNIKAT
ncbi:MAG: SDR family oxidoreductase [Flavobacteriales bacterium]|nr:SDR family oxidoreductase [Flavobacteriales bacterium]